MYTAEFNTQPSRGHVRFSYESCALEVQKVTNIQFTASTELFPGYGILVTRSLFQNHRVNSCLPASVK